MLKVIAKNPNIVVERNTETRPHKPIMVHSGNTIFLLWSQTNVAYKNKADDDKDIKNATNPVTNTRYNFHNHSLESQGSLEKFLKKSIAAKL